MNPKTYQGLIFNLCLLMLSGCSHDVPKITPRLATPVSPTPTAAPEPVRYHLYIPMGDGRLYKRVEENRRLLLTHRVLSGGGYDWSLDAATEAIKRLLKAAPDKFPPGTKLVSDVSGKSGMPSVNFNRAFSEPTWWNEPIRGRDALYAIVNTAIYTKLDVWTTSDEDTLTFFVEGKPLRKLGIYDFSKPFDPLDLNDPMHLRYWARVADPNNPKHLRYWEQGPQPPLPQNPLTGSSQN